MSSKDHKIGTRAFVIAAAANAGLYSESASAGCFVLTVLWVLCDLVLAHKD